MKKLLILTTILALASLPAAAAETEAAPGCCQKGAKVERTVENTSDGVRVTITTSDPEMIAAIQSCSADCAKACCEDCPMHAEGVTRTVEKTSSGIVITAKATTAELVTALQDHAANRNAQACSRHGGAKAGSAGDTAGEGHCRGKAQADGCCAKGKRAGAKA